MRVVIATLTAALVTGGLLCAGEADQEDFRWEPWRYLPAQEGGRYKPLDTLAWETMRTLCNRSHVTDPQTGQTLDPPTFYLAILFEWQGWDHPPNGHVASGLHGRAAYSRLHRPDKWDEMPMLRVDFLALRDALGMADGQKYISPQRLSQARIERPDSGQPTPFLHWAQQLKAQRERGLSALETKSLELAEKLWAYQAHRMGQRLAILPDPNDDDDRWLSVASLLRTTFDDTSDPSGALRRAQRELQSARAAYLTSSAADFNRASAAFLTAVHELASRQPHGADLASLGLEVSYNRWVPFRFAWVLMTLAFVFLLLRMGTGWKPFSWGAWSTYAAGLGAMLVGFSMRVMISGRAPVTNMYESVIYLALGVSLLGLLFEIVLRRQYVMTAAAGVATVALILADNCPAVLDPSLRPLQPVLRSNFWLVTHVMTITLSYAAFALALGIGNITLGFYMANRPHHDAIGNLTRLTYRAIQVGVLLLASGTILGGVWADYSWGRFWGWDPKEVWALVALLGYLAVLHARFAGWVKSFGLAALSILCFSLVVMAWYGVNYVLGAGLHSYGFGGGGQIFVSSAVALQAVFVAVAAVRYRRSHRMEHSVVVSPIHDEGRDEFMRGTDVPVCPT